MLLTAVIDKSAMKYPSVAAILAAVGGVGFGFGLARFSSMAAIPTPLAAEAASTDALSMTTDPIVSIVAAGADDEKSTKVSRGAKSEGKKRAAPPAQKTAARAKSVAALVKELEEIRKAPAGKRNKEKESALFDEWIALDPAGASAWAADIFANGGDEQYLRKAAQGYARRDPRAAATWAASLASPLVRDSALREVFENWSGRDLRGAAEMVRLLPIGTAQSTAASVVGKHFARADFDGALAWMGALAAPIQGAAFQTIMRTMWEQTGSNNPGAALPWLQVQSSVAFREQGIRFIAAEWAKRDPLSALGSAALLSQSSDRNLFTETTLRTFAQTNPREAALWLANQPPSPQTERLMNQVMATWTAFEPSATARWASELPNPALRSKSITAVAESWAKVDPDGLVSWIGSLSDVAKRDAAVEGATRVWMREDPATAAQWAAGIADRGKRDNSLMQVIREWKQHDMAAALAFIQATPAIDNSLRKRLLR